MAALQRAAQGFFSSLDCVAMILATMDTTLSRLLEYSMIRVISASIEFGSIEETASVT